MLAAAIALIALGIVLGIFFPVMFVAAAVGVVLLIVFLVGASRRAQTGSVGSADGAPPPAE
jgi:hypothetical protein